MSWIFDALRAHPELALFLTPALGNVIGRARVGGVQVGSVIGVLIAGVVVGQIGIRVSEDLKACARAPAPVRPHWRRCRRSRRARFPRSATA